MRIWPGGIENGMIVAGHTPTLSKDYMMYNGGLVYQHYDPQKNCLYYDIDCGCSYRTVRANARLACLCAGKQERFITCKKRSNSIKSETIGLRTKESGKMALNKKACHRYERYSACRNAAAGLLHQRD